MLKYAYFIAQSTKKTIQISFPSNNCDPWKTVVENLSQEMPKMSLYHIVIVENKEDIKTASQMDSSAKPEFFSFIIFLGENYYIENCICF